MSQKAVVITSPKHADLVSDRPLPILRNDYILVKTVGVALNPTDWKHVEDTAPPGVLVGCDYAGIVEAVGKDVKKPFRKSPARMSAILEDKAFAEKFWAMAQKLLAEGKVKPHPVSVREGGLRGVLEGMQAMKEDKVSGEKLVYHVGEI
ncbi:hypothetical protein EYZ11_009964 [Aspergillus tanneri]|uniref:Alcohol dehydrogenase-like N-terminal domain-containing protein n=1 Tax=Aspergillus tanneri TaxID=1220188 RepID=A0A4S3J6I3_9EURO|nr:hypothetical protein EYZ11_009964 [Aspergillus tanneri]